MDLLLSCPPRYVYLTALNVDFFKCCFGSLSGAVIICALVVLLNFIGVMVVVFYCYCNFEFDSFYIDLLLVCMTNFVSHLELLWKGRIQIY